MREGVMGALLSIGTLVAAAEHTAWHWLLLSGTQAGTMCAAQGALGEYQTRCTSALHSTSSPGAFPTPATPAALTPNLDTQGAPSATPSTCCTPCTLLCPPPPPHPGAPLAPPPPVAQAPAKSGK